MAKRNHHPIGLWHRTPYLRTERLVLEPLRTFHARPMTAVLADPQLYEFTGGEPPRHDQLVRRYTLLFAGSRSETEHWHNWIVSERSSTALIGHVQATVCPSHCDLAWTIGTQWQGQRYATEASKAMQDWLVRCGVTRFEASIHPDHIASQRVAKALNLELQGRMKPGDDGEQRWSTSSRTAALVVRHSLRW